MSQVTQRPTPAVGGWRGLFRTSAGIAVAMGVMNVATYAFQMIAARLLGPADYGAIAGLMALLMVIAVLQLGLQATAARRIAEQPGHVAQIERAVLRVSVRAALALGLVLLLAAPLVHRVLRLDSVMPAVLLAVAAVPLTVMGGQAGILQGERRWVALSMVYLGVGVPRVVLGTICILVAPTETSAMVGVMLGMWVPAVAGWWALRRGRAPGGTSHEHAAGPVARETGAASLALLAFFVLSNVDIVVARNLLDSHAAGLYAGGLILTKAVLFLPQFVVVVAFPAMSTSAGRVRALVLSLAVVLGLGVVCTGGAWLLSDLALVFVGGGEYADVRDQLWLFAVLGTLLAMIQLVVYAGLARRDALAAAITWVAVLALVASSLVLSTMGVTGVDTLAATVSVVDAVLLAALLGYSVWRLRGDAEPSVGGVVPAVPGADGDVERDGELGRATHP